MTADRFFAWIGSAISNASLFGAIAAGWPGLPAWTSYRDVPNGHIVLDVGFRPYIVDTASYGGPSQEGPRCPEPRALGTPFHLVHAPLPAGFNPMAYPNRTMSACVRVGDNGKVLGVVLAGVKERDLASILMRTIRDKWYFSPSGERGEAGWFKVRLNVGPRDAPAPEPPPLL